MCLALEQEYTRSSGRGRDCRGIRGSIRRENLENQVRRVCQIHSNEQHLGSGILELQERGRNYREEMITGVANGRFTRKNWTYE